MRLLPCFLLSALLFASAASANEFWLQPVRYLVAPGARVHLGRWIGQDFTGQRWSGLSARLEELRHYQPGGLVADLTPEARRADTLQTTVTLTRPGTHLLALRTNHAALSMSAAEFNAYLKQEGLENILYLRQRRKATDKPARETYCRYAKTLLQAGPASTADTTWRRRAGHALEIVPEQNPYTLPAGRSLTLLVLADGKPVSNQPVHAWLKSAADGSVVHLRLRTNPNGRTLLRMQQPAVVLLAAVRMTPHPLPATADWQSAWASLTFAFSGR